MKDKKFMSYHGHAIWYNELGFMVALKRNGTDDYFDTYEEAMRAIDEKEDRMNTPPFEQRLSKHLQKCEIEFCAKEPHGHCVDWLAEYCDTVEHIALKLRELGFKIKRKVDEEPWAGEIHHWVETSSGIIVYVNTPGVRGLVAKRSR